MRGRRAVLGVVSSLLLLVGCAVTGDSEEPGQGELGQEIVVTGAVQRRVDSSGFLIEDGAEDGGLLVVTSTPDVDVGAVVEVHGVVRRFERSQIQTEVGRALDATRYADFEDRDFVLADRIEREV